MRCSLDGGASPDASGDDGGTEAAGTDARDPDVPGTLPVSADAGEADVPEVDAPKADATETDDAPSMDGANDGIDTDQGGAPGGAPCPTGTYCIDGYCCDMQCQGPCRACDLPASPGVCSAVSKGLERASCRDTSACDGAGACKKKNGQTCAAQGECLSGYCVDGVCCNFGCTGICQTCAKEGSVGTCSPVPDGMPDDGATPPCRAPGTCNGAGGCRQGNGGRCASANDCLSMICVDGVCCDMACAAECMACNVMGKVGTCSPVPSGAADDPSCSRPESCDGMGHCRHGAGAPCTSSLSCSTGICCGAPGDPKTCQISSEGCACEGQPGVCRGAYSICCGAPGVPKTCQISSERCACDDDAGVCQGTFGVCCGEPGDGKTCRLSPEGCDCSQNAAVCGSRTCCASGPRAGTCQPGPGSCN